MEEPLQDIQEKVTILTRSVDHLQTDVNTLKVDMGEVKEVGCYNESKCIMTQ